MTALIITAILAGVFAFVAYIVSLIPNIDVGNVVNISNVLLKYGLALLPAECWSTFLATIIAFNGYQFTWAIIEWTYKKIPGIK